MITQLEHALSVDPTTLVLLSYDELRRCMDAIFTFVQQQCAADPEVAQYIRAIFADRPCILHDRTLDEIRLDGGKRGGGVFLRAAQVAFEFQHNCAPYLYGLTSERSKRHGQVLSLIGVKPHFEVGD